jgi:hypothetical protein
MMRMRAEDLANTTGRGPSGKSPAQISQALISLIVLTSETIRQQLLYESQKGILQAANKLITI